MLVERMTFTWPSGGLAKTRRCCATRRLFWPPRCASCATQPGAGSNDDPPRPLVRRPARRLGRDKYANRRRRVGPAKTSIRARVRSRSRPLGRGPLRRGVHRVGLRGSTAFCRAARHVAATNGWLADVPNIIKSADRRQMRPLRALDVPERRAFLPRATDLGHLRPRAPAVDPQGPRVLWGCRRRPPRTKGLLKNELCYRLLRRVILCLRRASSASSGLSVVRASQKSRRTKPRRLLNHGLARRISDVGRANGPSGFRG